MSRGYSFASELKAWFNQRLRIRSWWLCAVATLTTVAVIGSMWSQAAAGDTPKQGRVSGAAKTIIEGGSGGAAPVPVTTLLAFHANSQGGDFECLALAPPKATGPNSGEFSVNVMYVSGKVNSLDVGDNKAKLQGTATVTGLGAGHDVPFTAWLHAGGPGATVKLQVSGLTFLEIVVEGQISVD